MSVGEICNREVVTAHKEDTVIAAAKLMRARHAGSIVVVEGEGEAIKPLGIITDRDFVVELMAKDVDVHAVTLQDLMGSELLMAREADGIWETILRMRAMGVRRLPVVDDTDHYLVGILTMDDLLEFLAGEFYDLAKLVRREMRRETETRSDEEE